MDIKYFIIVLAVSVGFIAVGYFFNRSYQKWFGYSLWPGTAILLISSSLYYYVFENGAEDKNYILFLVIASVIVLGMLVFNVLKSHNIPYGFLATVLQLGMSAGILFLLLVLLALTGRSKKSKSGASKGTKRR